jgi:uncharacterized protein YukE
MSEQRVNTTVVEAMASSIATINTGIKSDFDAVDNAMSALASSWQGAASDNARSAFASIRNTFVDERYKVVDSYVKFLRGNVSQGYINTESSVKSLSDAFR